MLSEEYLIASLVQSALHNVFYICLCSMLGKEYLLASLVQSTMHNVFYCGSPSEGFFV